MLSAKAMGASKVVMADMIKQRCDKALEVGADDVIQVTRDMTPQQIAKLAEEKLGGMPDITIECTGAEPCIQVSGAVETLPIRALDWNLRDKIRRLFTFGWPRKGNGKLANCQRRRP